MITEKTNKTPSPPHITKMKQKAWKQILWKQDWRQDI